LPYKNEQGKKEKELNSVYICIRHAHFKIGKRKKSILFNQLSKEFALREGERERYCNKYTVELIRSGIQGL
jgi:hypothetical protein